VLREISWFNGRFQSLEDIRVSPFDRGFTFADGIYEVIRLYQGVPFELEAHIERLFRSAAGLQLTLPRDRDGYRELLTHIVATAGKGDGVVYGQITRGAAPRLHVYQEGMTPTEFWWVKPLPVKREQLREQGYKAIIVEDDRWTHCDWKTIGLLSNGMAKTRAARRGADEALYVRPEGDIVTEGCASNVMAVKDGIVYTHPLGRMILPGITRQVTLSVASAMGIVVKEEARPLSWWLDADEVFFTGTTIEVTPCLQLGLELESGDVAWQPVGHGALVGKPGPITMELSRGYEARVERAVAPAMDSLVRIA